MFSLKNKKCLILFALFLFFVSSEKSYAATLFTSPSQPEVSVGNIVSIQVFVNTTGKVINNAEGILQFPRDLLEVVSLDKSASIFSLWVEDPSYSNNTGQVTFNGGVPNPGFQGNAGKIMSITFRTKKVGVASVVFSNSAVRENDGLGTDILSSKTGSEIKIISGVKPVETPTSPVIQPVENSNFRITSSSHPDQNSWYNKSDAELSWTLPKNATAVKTLLGAYKNSDPTVYYNSPVTSKSIDEIEDGTWYFHVNYLADGIWSKTQHYKLQIDTVSPVDLSIVSEKDDTGKITLRMKAEDSLSGIDYYQVTADSDEPITVKSDADGEASIEIPFSRSGEHDIFVSVFDKAKNKAETKIKVTSDSVPELRIESYPAEIKVNESIEVSGTAPYPYASLRVSLKNDDNVVETYKIKSNSYSKFNFTSQPVLSEGKYTLWVDMLKDDEEISVSSERVNILVDKPLLLQIGSYTIGLMKVLIPAALLLITFSLLVLYGWHKFFNLYRKVRKESREVEQVLGKSFDILRKDLRGHINGLKKSRRKTASKDVEFLEQFEEELSEAEKAIGKEVQDISRR